MTTETIGLAKQTDSTIIIFIVVLIGGIIALRPILKMWLAAKEQKHKREIAQQDKLLSVIQANTEVNSSLKTVLEEDHKNCSECRRDQKKMIEQLQDSQDITNMKLVAIHSILVKEDTVNAD